MTGTEFLIAAIIIVFVIAFVVTMLFVNAQTSKIIDVNAKLAESQNTLLAQNKTQTDRLERLEEQAVSLQKKLADRQRTLDEQQQNSIAVKNMRICFMTPIIICVKISGCKGTHMMINRRYTNWLIIYQFRILCLKSLT